MCTGLIVICVDATWQFFGTVEEETFIREQGKNYFMLEL